MQKLRTFLFFFTLCLALSSPSFAQNRDGRLPANFDSVLKSVNIDSVLKTVQSIDLDSVLESNHLNLDSVLASVQHLNFDSILKAHRPAVDSALQLLKHFNIDSLIQNLGIENLLGSLQHIRAPAPKAAADAISIRWDGDTIRGQFKIPMDSIPGYVGSMPSQKHYFSKNGQHYFMNILPPVQKGHEVDHSKIWLLRQELAQTWD